MGKRKQQTSVRDQLRAEGRPSCLLAMGCLCAGHARGAQATAPCETDERHQHTADCYARNASGPLAYTPCRADGLDRNLTNMNSVDFEAQQRVNGDTPVRGLTLICTQVNPAPKKPRGYFEHFVLAEVESRNFRFQAAGRTKAEALAAMRRMFAVHIEQHRPHVDPEHFRQLEDDISYTEMEIGGGYRDGVEVTRG